jgi:hypothetical protein
MRIPEHGIRYPELGDIWEDDNGEYYLFLTEPSWKEGEVLINCLMLNTGEIRFRFFDIDPQTGTLYDWYWKVA